MRFEWLRFDSTTLLAALWIGLIPSLLLAVASFYYLQRLSIPLHDLMEGPHQERARAFSLDLEQSVRSKLRLMQQDLIHAVANTPLNESNSNTRADEIGQAELNKQQRFTDWPLVKSLSWYPLQSEALLAADNHEIRQIEELLVRLPAENLKEREKSLKTLRQVPIAYEDPMGFSYSLEASLYTEKVGLPSFHRAMMKRGGQLDQASYQEFLDQVNLEIQIPSIPVPIQIKQDARPLVNENGQLNGSESFRFLVDTPEGSFLCDLNIKTLLQASLSELTSRKPLEAEAFLRLAYEGNEQPNVSNTKAINLSDGVSASAEAVDRVWATQSLASPFGPQYSIEAGSRGERLLNPLLYVDRLNGMQSLWGLVAIFVVAIVLCFACAAMLSRRVQLSKRKDSFLRLVSHELRTPIASMKVSVETLLLGRVRDEAESKQFLKQIDSETERLADLVERVLEFGRANSGSINVREVITDPGTLVEESIQIFSSRNPDWPVPKFSHVQLFIPALLDPKAIQEVILNLLSNAAKYAEEVHTLEVSIAESSRYLFISVKDHGPGISRQEIKKIFKPFHRGAHNNKAGFGLGLAYCQEVMKAHKGSLKVKSVLGEGSTFTLQIPLNSPPERNQNG